MLIEIPYVNTNIDSRKEKPVLEKSDKPGKLNPERKPPVIVNPEKGRRQPIIPGLTRLA